MKTAVLLKLIPLLCLWLVGDLHLYSRVAQRREGQEYWELLVGVVLLPWIRGFKAELLKPVLEYGKEQLSKEQREEHSKNT